jgi:hypothetical protein
MQLLTSLWHRLLDPQPAPPPLLVAVTAVAALVLVATYQSWKLGRHVVTIAHEGGHALAALLTGRRLSGIRLHSDTSGLTVSRGRPTGPGMIATMLAGYVTPSLIGLLGAFLLTTRHVTLMLWLALVLLFAMLVMIRNVFGVVSVVVAGAVVFVVSWYASPAVQAGFAYLSVWFLLAGGVRPIAELQRMRRRRMLPDSDADQLARLTRVPGIFWVGLFAVVTVAAAFAGTWLLLRNLPLDVRLPGAIR